jgi:ABC-type oligopeptide transport system substrate-binding subunit
VRKDPQLAFQRGLDLLAVPPGFAMQSPRASPFLERRGVRMSRTPTPVLFYLSFNMENPVVGGIDPGRVALRRAIGLAFDAADYVVQVLHGEGLVAHGR